VVSTRCPPTQKPRGAITQTQALVELSESFVAMGVEGPYWLAKLNSRSYQTKVRG